MNASAPWPCLWMRGLLGVVLVVVEVMYLRLRWWVGWVVEEMVLRLRPRLVLMVGMVSLGLLLEEVLMVEEVVLGQGPGQEELAVGG